MLDLTANAAVRRALGCLNAQDYLQAELIAQDLLARNKNDVNAHHILGQVASAKSRPEEAIPRFEKCISLQPKVIDHYLNLAAVYTTIGKYALAISRYEQAQKVKPGDLRALSGMANALDHAGKRDRARETLRQLIADGREDIMCAYAWARLALADKDPREAIRVLRRHIPAPAYPNSYFFTLGAAFDQIGDLENAFNAYRTANARSGEPFDLDAQREFYARLMRVFSHEALRGYARAPSDHRAPIFIAGRPRGGTTLVEKILDAHPDVAGVGEAPFLARSISHLPTEVESPNLYPECVRDMSGEDAARLSRAYLDAVATLAKGRLRTVDKHLRNYEFLGVAQMLFPQARVIHITRDPVDHCWACFTADVQADWTRDLRTLGITQRLYERLMRHWRASLDLPILEVSYEGLVDDQEGWTRKILAFCELPWSDRCLRFYDEGSKRPSAAAPTLSYNQVRQPIYKSSVGRATRFASFLGELHEGLSAGQRIADAM